MSARVDAMRVVALEHAVTLGCKNGWSDREVITAANTFLDFVQTQPDVKDGETKKVLTDQGFHVVTEPGRRFVLKQWVDDNDCDHLIAHEDSKERDAARPED